MKWKICGMREVENCVEIAQFNPDFMGFIWVEKSPRYVGADYVIPKSIPNEVKKVGVFVNEAVEKIVGLAESAGFDWVQLHGEEGAEEIEALKKAGLGVIKAISVSTEADVREANNFRVLPDYFLFDTKKGATVGGTGERFDWHVLSSYHAKSPIILAGGLEESNLAEALALAAKYPIEVLDFNSKLEVAPALKDVEKVRNLSRKIN